MPSPTGGASSAAISPRRSTRMSSLSQSEKKAGKEKVGAKRSADEDDGAGPAGQGVDKSKAKKAKVEGDQAAETKALDIGDPLPSLTVKNEEGKDIDVAGLASEKGVVLFLVPKADTPGCTTQACGFRDIYPDFTSSEFDVYCLSADKPAAQTKWQTKKNLPYSLLSDTERVLIRVLGAGKGGKTQRSHFIFEKGGKLIDKKIPVKPADSPKLALEFIKGLQ